MLELSIINSKPIADHILEIYFSDGHKCLVDFHPFVFSVGHPDYDIYKQRRHFLNYKIVDGNLNWDDYKMIFPVADLYSNRLVKSK